MKSSKNFAGYGNSRNGGARVPTFQNRREPSLSGSYGEENVSDEQQFDASSIINSAFDKRAVLAPSFSLAGKN